MLGYIKLERRGCNQACQQRMMRKVDSHLVHCKLCDASSVSLHADRYSAHVQSTNHLCMPECTTDRAHGPGTVNAQHAQRERGRLAQAPCTKLLAANPPVVNSLDLYVSTTPPLSLTPFPTNIVYFLKRCHRESFEGTWVACQLRTMTDLLVRGHGGNFTWLKPLRLNGHVSIRSWITNDAAGR